MILALCTADWLACLVMFWVWWLDSSQLVTWAGMLINSALLFYLSYIPAYFILLVNRLRGISTELALPNVRVAFAVTKAPSEPWPLARTTLAMLSQRFDAPYDVWLCDEDPSEEILTWCRGRGVRVSTRRGQPEYHRAQWPGRTKCKEGNLAFFYDRFGYRDYDVVAQLNCDANKAGSPLIP
jgi:cellulose synthase (UDP-forming)